MKSMDNEDLKIEIPSIESLREELAREESRYSFRRTLLSIAGVLVVAAAITALMATRLFVLIRINGDSMKPTLENEEIVFLRQTKDIETGDIVGFYYGGRILLKRAVGSAGDEIEMYLLMEGRLTNRIWIRKIWEDVNWNFPTRCRKE